MKNIVDDIFSFNIYRQYTCSKPEDNALSFNKYKAVGVVVSAVLDNFGLDLETFFNIQGLPEPLPPNPGGSYYNLSIEELNLVYNHLINLAEGKDNTTESLFSKE
jgi:hypothetical protein